MSLTLIIGPMYAGKTSELLRIARRRKVAQRKVITIKYNGDTRTPCIITHDGQGHSFDKIEISTLHNVSWEICKDYNDIFIDEVQFIPGVYEFITELMDHDKDIYCSGLNGDRNMQAFPEMARLIPIASDIKYIRAVCEICSRKASYTKYIAEPVDIPLGEPLPGGKNMYISVCYKCWALPNNHPRPRLESSPDQSADSSSESD